MRLISALLLALGVILAAGSAMAKVSETGTFISVTGTVTIKSQYGKNNRLAQAGSTVSQGERVITDKDSSAVLQFFDGSQLTIKPGTDFWLSKLQKPSDKDKILKFKLLAGNLLAKVTKLASTNSAFEVEAGGVVCGVRGTEFSMNYDPSTNKLTLTVLEGSVFSDIGGHVVAYGAGTQIEFVDGKFQGITGGNSGVPGGKPGNNDIVLTDKTLGDLQQTLGNVITVNGDNVFTDPAVGGSNSLVIRADVPSQEVQKTVNVILNVSGPEGGLLP
ncbi:MAG TPA: FecR domain-containing protein [bacterium]|nr:FecR domain-containing protein [bacterium]